MKTINLKSNGLGRYDDVSPFIVTENKLELKVELPNLNGEFYLIAENNGSTFKKLLTGEAIAVLEGLTAGELKAEVKHYLKGVHIKTYKVEPLLLREADGSLSGTPEIVELRAQIATLVNSFKEYKRAAEEQKKTQEERGKRLTAMLISLMRFAFKDYKNNVYLGCGSLEEFIKEFGFELTDEEIKLIKGEIYND